MMTERMSDDIFNKLKPADRRSGIAVWHEGDRAREAEKVFESRANSHSSEVARLLKENAELKEMYRAMTQALVEKSKQVPGHPDYPKDLQGANA